MHEHLQLAIELEIWTIPFYAIALASIKDPDSYESALLRAIVRQELAHTVALANIANAFGRSPTIRAPRYGGPTLPHLDFDLDTPNPTSLFAPHTTALGALDHPRLNTMCLIEYPAWPTGNRSLRQLDLADYASVRDLFDSLALGVAALREHVRGDLEQVADGRFAELRIRSHEQIAGVLELVREQGEGAAVGEGVPAHAALDADDPEPGTSHFAKLNELRDGPLPEVWAADPASSDAELSTAFESAVERAFAAWERRFADGDGDDLDVGLERIIAAATECWRAGVVPSLG